MYRFAFVCDHQVGWRTQALNLERVVRTDPTIAPTFVPVKYEGKGGLLSRLPGLPESLRGTLRGIAEVRDGLGNEKWEAALYLSWVARNVPDLIAATPSFLVLDMTPLQMEAMGELYGYSRGRARFLGSWKRRATERLYRNLQHLFPLSEWTAASLHKDYGVPREKMTVLPPGVNLDLYHPDPLQRPNDGIVRLLFVGGHFSRKGGDLVQRWVRERRAAHHEDFEVHVVTRDEISSEPGLVVHRNVMNNSPELIHLYQKCDLFVLPTRADCYSLVAMEAMAAGLPVVISDMAGIPDLVIPEKTGFLIAPDDYKSLAATLDRLVENSDLRERMSTAARHHAEHHFDSRANVEKMIRRMKESTSK